MKHDSVGRKLSCIVALVMIVASACTRETLKEEPGAPVSPLTIKEAEPLGTKTAFSKEDGLYYSYWNNNDKLRIFFGKTGTHEDKQYHFKNTAENRAAANFVYYEPHSGSPALNTLAAGKYSVMGFYPNSSGISHLNYAGSPYMANSTWCLVKVPPTQAPQAAGPDASADVLLMEPFEFEYDGETTSICNTHFTRATAVIRIVVKDEGGLLAGKDIKSLVFEASDSTLAGNAILDMKSGGGFIEAPFKNNLGNNVSKSKSITANYSEAVAASGCEVFLSTVPQVIENNTFTVTMLAGDGDSGRVKVTASLTPGIVEMKAGKITSFAITVLENNVTELAFYGEGTNDSPYFIECENDLLKLSQLTNGADYGNWIDKTYKQMNDIELTADNFTPISQTNSFWGTYNGNDKKISGLKISETGKVSNIGLFGSISSYNNSTKKEDQNCGRVMKLTLESPVISTTGESNFVAALVGLAKGGKIDRCHVTGAAISKKKNPATGVILGGTTSRKTIVKDCSVSSSSIVNEGNGVGGAAIVGRISHNIDISGCTVKNCSISGQSEGFAGILGYVKSPVNDIRIRKCVVGSKCTISGTASVGGILGCIPKDTVKVVGTVAIDSCVVYGDISGTGQYIGGIVGAATNNNTYEKGGSVVVSNCAYINGTIFTSFNDATKNTFIGGIVGGRGGKAKKDLMVSVLNCYSRPEKIEAPNGASGRWSVGGIFGGMHSNREAYCCWSDVTYDATTQTGSINPGASDSYGAITTQLNAASNGCSAEYCYGLIQLKGSESGTFSNSETLDEEAFKGEKEVEADNLITKLNAAVNAYNLRTTDKKATLSAWEAKPNEYPTLKGMLADPDAVNAGNTNTGE